jgi:hypothetical protein
VRDRLRLKPGDVLKYEIEGGWVVLSKATSIDAAYLEQLEKTLSDCDSPEDATAYDHL